MQKPPTERDSQSENQTDSNGTNESSYKSTEIFHPLNVKTFTETLFKDGENTFKHLCDGCDEVFQSYGLYPVLIWCPHCSKGCL